MEDHGERRRALVRTSEPPFDFGAAYTYYKTEINRGSRFQMLDRFGFQIQGSVPFRDWELFGAILVRDKGTPGYGSDLERFEVKSACLGSSFEYQYHLNRGVEKLEHDKRVDHIFISYSRDYQNVEVRVVLGHKLAPTFESWRPSLIANYEGNRPKQRFRRSITYGFVAKNGDSIMKIERGALTVPRLES